MVGPASPPAAPKIKPLIEQKTSANVLGDIAHPFNAFMKMNSVTRGAIARETAYIARTCTPKAVVTTINASVTDTETGS